MKTNVKVDLDDTQLNRLACLLAGKPVKAKAKRRDIQAFVASCIDQATSALPVDAPVPVARLSNDMPPAHLLRKVPEAQQAGYIRGWQNAGRLITKRRVKLHQNHNPPLSWKTPDTPDVT